MTVVVARPSARGRVIFEGTPQQLMDAPGSLTGEHLARGRSLAGRLATDLVEA